MNMFKKISLLVICGLVLGSVSIGYAADKGNFSTSPKTNNGKKWRIGYFQGGDYTDYPKVLRVTLEGLMELGWFDKTEIPSFAGKPAGDFWKWLGANLSSKYIEFVQDAFYSADWNEDLRMELAAKVIERLNQQQDIDLMIAMGTKAGQSLANDQHHTATKVLSTTDAIGAKIIKSAEDSGFDHVHARVDPNRQERQVQIFHDIFGFQQMGLYYTDTTDGRSYAAIDKIENVANEGGFELVRCYTKDASAGEEAAVESVHACLHELGKQVEAIFITIHPAIKMKHIPEMVNIINSYKVPTFSQYGSEEVKMGILLSISQAGFSYLGQFEGEVIAKILNGAKPRQIGQLFEDPPKIAINLKTAEIIGYDVPVDVIGAADEIYQEYEKSE